jgi:class 3 adenylate cyclase
MPELPSPILDYVVSLVRTDRFPAYLYLDESGRLLDWGGSLEVYGLCDLKGGESIGKQVFFLEGLLPLTSDLVLPRVKTEGGRSAEIHIFRRSGQVWVLLMDATAAEAQTARAQQKAHELSLLREKESRTLDQYLGRDAAPALDGRLLFQEKGQRSEATVFFADLLGFSQQSKRDSAEAVVDTYGFYLRTIMQIIQDEAGIAEKAINSSVVAVFGAISSAGFPAKQAVQSALRVAEAVTALNEVRQKEFLTTFDISIGITSGPVVLGILGYQERKILCAIGATADRAARFQAAARAREILIDEETFRKIGNFQERFSEIFLPVQTAEMPGKCFSCLVTQ